MVELTPFKTLGIVVATISLVVIGMLISKLFNQECKCICEFPQESFRGGRSRPGRGGRRPGGRRIRPRRVRHYRRRRPYWRPYRKIQTPYYRYGSYTYWPFYYSYNYVPLVPSYVSPCSVIGEIESGRLTTTSKATDRLSTPAWTISLDAQFNTTEPITFLNKGDDLTMMYHPQTKSLRLRIKTTVGKVGINIPIRNHTEENHYAWVQDGKYMKFYINAILVHTQTLQSPPQIASQTLISLNAGDKQAVLNDVRICDRALSAYSIKAYSD